MGPRDVDLVHAIMQAFVADPSIDPARIRVAAEAGRVTLDGRVATHAQRLAAVTVAASLPGVTAVANELTVDEIETATTRATDAGLLDEVTRAVHASTVAVTDLAATVRHRVAALEGVVASERDRAALGRAVQQVPGIHFVDNRLAVSAEPAPAGLTELDPGECLRLLAGERFGRLAVRDGDGVDVFPVDYVLHDEAVYFRSGPGVKLLRLAEAPEVAFEIDGFGDGEAWSVVVKGTARRLDDDAEIAASGIAVAPSAHPTEKLNYVRIRPRELTGRRFRV
jgi:Predicted periplasmic or secreted lipoprotein